MIWQLEHNDSNLIALLYSLSIFQQCKVILFDSLCSSCHIKFWLFSTKNDDFYFKSKKKFLDGTDLKNRLIFCENSFVVWKGRFFLFKNIFLGLNVVKVSKLIIIKVESLCSSYLIKFWLFSTKNDDFFLKPKWNSRMAKGWD